MELVCLAGLTLAGLSSGAALCHLWDCPEVWPFWRLAGTAWPDTENITRRQGVEKGFVTQVTDISLQVRPFGVTFLTSLRYVGQGGSCQQRTTTEAGT